MRMMIDTIDGPNDDPHDHHHTQELVHVHTLGLGLSLLETETLGLIPSRALILSPVHILALGIISLLQGTETLTLSHLQGREEKGCQIRHCGNLNNTRYIWMRTDDTPVVWL